jgi:glycopeptide antibiotics resistance protein
VDTVLNVILFIPLGLFLPLLYEKYNKIKQNCFYRFPFFNFH